MLQRNNHLFYSVDKKSKKQPGEAGNVPLILYKNDDTTIIVHQEEVKTKIG